MDETGQPLKRAWSVLTIKSVSEDDRIIEGIATTPTPDSYGDIVEPKGAEFKLPIPLLWQHRSGEPIGHVIEAKVTDEGITVKAQFVKTDEPGKLKDRLDEAWQSVKLGLVGGLSIGFQSIEHAKIEGTWSYRFLKWMWLELSAVTIPANSEATISLVRSMDLDGREAPKSQEPELKGHVVRLDDAIPGVPEEPYIIKQIIRKSSDV